MTRTVWTASRADLIQALERVTRERNAWRARAGGLAEQTRVAEATTIRRDRELAALDEREQAALAALDEREQAALSGARAGHGLPEDPDAQQHRADLLAALRGPADVTKAS